MKLSKRILALAVVSGVLAVFARSAFADDVQPPPWRGQYSTTSQFWEFMTLNPGPLQPDGSPTGGQPWLPSTHLIVYPDGDWIAADPASGREGIWPLSGEMWVTVDNHNPPNEVKYMWVQLTWRYDPNKGDKIPPILSDFDPMYAMPPGLTIEPVVDLGFGWYETTYKWEIRPNPPDEFFIISGNILVDELVIDTWCIPEPSTLALAGFGGGLLLVLRRRRADRT